MQSDQRPWGSFLVVHDTPNFKVKVITVIANSRLSLQRHEHRSEHWFVVSGSGVAYRDSGDGGHAIHLVAGCSIDIPMRAIHRLEAHNDGLVVVEIQTGAILSEKDIERLSDDYGRETLTKGLVDE